VCDRGVADRCRSILFGAPSEESEMSGETMDRRLVEGTEATPEAVTSKHWTMAGTIAEPAAGTEPRSSLGASREARGLLWVVGSFAICPCHLPLTLGLLSTVLAGTALGAALHEHTVLAGLTIGGVWLFGTWRGLRLLSQGSACPVPQRVRGGRLRMIGGFLGLPAR
jgi:hypothetical protein